MKYSKQLRELIDKQGVRLDLGCGQSKMPGFIGMDNRPLENVDVVWDVTKFPYPLPSDSCQLVMASHLLEHIPPTGLPLQFVDLVELLIKKGLITEKEVKDHIGEVTTFPMFLRLMDEVWRILRVGGQFMISIPYAGSFGYWQDPTHINGITERTWEYFDPDGEYSRGLLYHLYEPKPWKVEVSAYQTEGNMEIVLIKREDKKKYHKYTPFTDEEKIKIKM
jgi:SAM-dependent methyltransferase